MASSFNETYFEKLYQIEDRHFWFRTRQAFVSALTEQIIADFPPGYRVMEIGCGTGNLLKALESTCRNGVVFGLDLFWEGLAFAQQRTTAGLIQARAECMPFCNNQFDLIGMFDVLEHLENDEGILTSIQQMLKPGGKLLLTVPAHGELWSTFDLISYHQRRYEPSDLKAKLIKSGFSVEYMSECMQVLHPLAKLRRKAPIILEPLSNQEKERTRKRANQELSIMPGMNEIAFQLLRLELKQIKQRKTIARGTSIIVIAQKEKDK
jgi:ubiquinone/menaquinone biosynthesis C-methylase UbiE